MYSNGQNSDMLVYIQIYKHETSQTKRMIWTSFWLSAGKTSSDMERGVDGPRLIKFVPQEAYFADTVCPHTYIHTYIDRHSISLCFCPYFCPFCPFALISKGQKGKRTKCKRAKRAKGAKGAKGVNKKGKPF